MAAMQEAIQELPMFITGCTVTTKYGAIVAIHDVTAEMTMQRFMGPKVHQVHLRPATDIAYQQLVRERKDLDNGDSMKALVAVRNLRKGDNSSEYVADLIGMLRM